MGTPIVQLPCEYEFVLQQYSLAFTPSKIQEKSHSAKVLAVCHWFKYFYGWRSFTQISHIVTNSQVSVYADFNRQPKTAFGVLIGFLAKFFFFLNQQIITEGIANDTTDYSYWDRERSLNALEREQWGRWPLIACMQMPSAKCQKARLC